MADTNASRKLSQILKDEFAPEVRQSAEFRELARKVRIRDSTSWNLMAAVKDNPHAEVSIDLDEDDLMLTCDCDYVQEYGEGCEHLWATILVAEQKQLLMKVVECPELNVLVIEEKDSWDPDGELDEDLDLYEREHEYRLSKSYSPRQSNKTEKNAKKRGKNQSNDWKHAFARIQQMVNRTGVEFMRPDWNKDKQLLYVLDVHSSLGHANLSFELTHQERKKDGDWSKPKFHSIPQEQAEQFTTEPDASIVSFLYGAQQGQAYGYYGHESRFNLSAKRVRMLAPLLNRTGRLFARFGPKKDEISPVTWDEGPPWQFRLQVSSEEKGKSYKVTGWLHRGDEKRSITEARALTANVVFWDDHCASLEATPGMEAWATILSKEKFFEIAAKKQDELMRDLLLTPDAPPVDFPEELRVTEERPAARPKLVIRASKRSYEQTLSAVLGFEYADHSIPLSKRERGHYDADTRRLIVRDPEAEAAAVRLLRKLGFRERRSYFNADGDFELSPRLLPKATLALLQAGWSVEAEGKLYRRSGVIQIEVTSGIDWFDLEGKVDFDGQVAPLPRLLQALKKGEHTIQLDDGTFGMVPEEWLKKYGMLADLGSVEGDQLRFSRRQAGLLDALLAAMPEASCDDAFRQAANELRSFEGIKPVDPTATFSGTLREYQREGLGWLEFLERFGFGGCLADDMGLGKTVQVLAHLAGRARADQRQKKLPTLIVAPRSLIFNWKQEAARFASHLKVLDHTGLGRGKSVAGFADWDVILTTYGTLRRDVLLFKDAKFDYCILDEAQVVKNAATDQAKAVRLINADHRLVLSGTPIENHLVELWSLFEFLNPGMLGRASLFQQAGTARNPDPETRAILAKGLRPFILRRTKQQVAKDLPAKTEQTLYCELESDQRKLYDELRDHYRQSLLKTIYAVGMNRAKIQVLEALLRLRQAACHPFLVDKKSTNAPSAKLDMLFPYLQEAVEKGQKTLVFSQFTSFLAIVRSMLDRDGLTYEYLDGKTRNRQAKVERFQNDPDCKLFLISLKAGGVGLNLTAAEYVFLLDPWWNPAVEAQAIDRTHRIGQTKPVFAYRIIAKDTVEEKVLELQNTKRNLADAILNADNSTLSSLKREDLEMLLS
ncbi:hypothetical protein BH10PLA2_BH10PLA2_03710 [soil metagenome]